MTASKQPKHLLLAPIDATRRSQSQAAQESESAMITWHEVCFRIKAYPWSTGLYIVSGAVLAYCIICALQ